MHINSVGIVGYGNFGSFVHELLKRFASNVTVRVHSLDKKPDGKLFFSLNDVARCDAVVLAIPIAAFEKVVQQILPLLSEHSIIVDVATVKLHTTKVLKLLAGNRHYIATHPMFGPESYEKRNKDVSGLRIVIAEHTLPKDAYEELKTFLRSCNFNVIEMNADKHDKHLAETLFLTHFIGQTIAHARFDRTEIDTVSFSYLMDAVESVRADKKLFADVFRYNPHCSDILERFKEAEGKVRKTLKGQR